MKKMFTDCISDDLIYIRQFKEICIDGKKRNLLPSLCIPSLCRFLVISSVSAIDHYLNYSEDSFPMTYDTFDNAILELIKPPTRYNTEDHYFQILNDKVSSFHSFAQTKQFKIDKNHIEIFMAIRMIRNAIIHSSWENNQIKNVSKRELESKARIKYVTQVGLTSDLMQFNESHWDMINHNEQIFLNFLYANNIFEKKN